MLLLLFDVDDLAEYVLTYLNDTEKLKLWLTCQKINTYMYLSDQRPIYLKFDDTFFFNHLTDQFLIDEYYFKQISFFRTKLTLDLFKTYCTCKNLHEDNDCTCQCDDCVVCQLRIYLYFYQKEMLKRLSIRHWINVKYTMREIKRSQFNCCVQRIRTIDFFECVSNIEEIKAIQYEKFAKYIFSVITNIEHPHKDYLYQLFVDDNTYPKYDYFDYELNPVYYHGYEHFIPLQMLRYHSIGSGKTMLLNSIICNMKKNTIKKTKQEITKPKNYNYYIMHGNYNYSKCKKKQIYKLNRTVKKKKRYQLSKHQHICHNKNNKNSFRNNHR